MEKCSGLLGNHQQVTIAQRADVEKAEHQIILVQLETGNLSRNDSGEDGFGWF